MLDSEGDDPTALARELTVEWIFNARLAPAARLVGLALLHCVRVGADPTIRRLAYMCRLDESTVKEHLLLIGALVQPGEPPVEAEGLNARV